MSRAVARTPPSHHDVPTIISPPYVVSAEGEVRRHGLVASKLTFSGGAGGRGFMKLFRAPVLIRLEDTEIISSPDEHGGVAIGLSPEQYSFLQDLQSHTRIRLIDLSSHEVPDTYGPVFNPSVRVSKISGRHYLKTKIRVGGKSPTMGIGFGEDTPTDVAVSSSLVPGARATCVVAIDGVYLTPQMSGLVTRLDLFKVVGLTTNPPSEPDVELDCANDEDEVKVARAQLCRGL